MKNSSNHRANPGLTGLTAKELAEATARYERETDVKRDTRSLTPAERTEFEAWRRRAGRPRKAQDLKVRRVLVSMEPELLKRLDAETRRRKTSRSGLIGDAVRKMLVKSRKSA